MDVIGLTGGIGTGKSTASAFLKEQGYAIIDADQIARQVVEPGSPLLQELARAFGEGIIQPNGSLDRKGLAAIAFSQPAKRQQLDRIMHGKIIEIINQKISQLKQQDGNKGIIIDAPLIFETGLDKQCSQVWLMVADTDVRIERVCRRDGMAQAEVSARIENQLTDEEKMKGAHVIIDNSGTEQQLKDHLRGLLKKC